MRNVAGEPLLEWCARHGLPRRFSDEVLVPLMAAVATVGVTEARTMPVGEVLRAFLFLPSAVPLGLCSTDTS